MGANFSRGHTDEFVAAVLPRSWNELELFHTRYQQEAHRRRVSEPQSQFFLTFSIFRTVVSPREERDDWRERARLLRAFDSLDRQHRQRIPALDFFAGLALVTTGKKATKVEFLLSLFDNAGLKTMNACEITIMVHAAARGLAMFRFTSEWDQRSLSLLGKRIAGGEEDVLRTDLAERVLMDPEIVFFMNGLDNEATMTSDSLLFQQYLLLKKSAATELRVHHACLERDRGIGSALRQPNRLDECAPQLYKVSLTGCQSLGIQQEIKHSTAVPAIEAILRRLEEAIHPQRWDQQNLINARNAISPSMSPLQSGAKRVDIRTLDRLVKLVSKGSQSLPAREANALMKIVSADQLNKVRSSQIGRALRPRLTRLSLPESSLWRAAAEYVHDLAHSCKLCWVRWFPKPEIKVPGIPKTNPSSSHAGFELNYHFKAYVNVDEDEYKNGSEKSEQVDGSPMCLRLRAIQRDQAPGDKDQFEGHCALVLRLLLKSELTDEQAVEVISTIQTFLCDESTRDLISFALDGCEATIKNEEGLAERFLCLHLRFKDNIFEAFETATGCHLARLFRGLFVSINFGVAADALIRTAEAIAEQFSLLMKLEERERLLLSIFARFDQNKDGYWSLQDFNAFQQAARQKTLNEVEFSKCFRGSKYLTADEFIVRFERYSTDELRSLIENLSLGSLVSQIKGTCIATVSLDKGELQVLESSFNAKSWARARLKDVIHAVQSLSDLSCEIYFQSLAQVLLNFEIGDTWWKHFLRPSSLVDGFRKVCSFLSPKHTKHDQEIPCQSLFCSIENELAKSVQQLDYEDQLHNLPPGTCARRASTLRKVYNAALLMLNRVDSIETVSIESPQVDFVCELDNFNWIRVVREATEQLNQVHKDV